MTEAEARKAKAKAKAKASLPKETSHQRKFQRKAKLEAPLLQGLRISLHDSNILKVLALPARNAITGIHLLANFMQKVSVRQERIALSFTSLMEK